MSLIVSQIAINRLPAELVKNAAFVKQVDFDPVHETAGTNQPAEKIHGGALSNSSQNTQIQNIDFSGRKGYQEDYSVRDAAESLWKQETQTFNLKDLEDPEKAAKILENMRQQARWDLGLDPAGSKEEAISSYIQTLRENGLDGTVDWSGLSRELNAFQTTTPEELEDGLNYLASRYVAVLDKLERNFSGEELAAQRAELEEVYQAGKAGMIDGYTQLLQSNLGVSDSGVQAIRDSFSTLLAERVDAYRGALGTVNDTISQTGPDSVWLKNHDAYIASQLRAAETAGQSKAQYSVQDLAAAGQIAQSYQAEIRSAATGSRNEATLALNLSITDMKAETMIQKGLVSQNMAALLRGSRSQGHQNALDALDQKLAEWERTRAPGEPKGTFAPVNRSLFQGIYSAVMGAFAQNGGNGAEAIRAGASYGKTATAQIHAQNPNIFRFGNPMQSYWNDFYTTPEPRAATRLEQHLNALLAQSGKTSQQGSDYQKYVSQWQDFINSIGGGVNIQA